MRVFLWLGYSHLIRLILVLGALLGVVVLARFARYIKLVSKHDIDSEVIAEIMFWNLANIMELLLPLALMLALALLMIRLNNEGELSAWYNCGFSRARLGWAMLSPVLVVLPVFVLLVFLWAPTAKQRIEFLLEQPSHDFWLQYVSSSALTIDNGRVVFADIIKHDKYKADLSDIQITVRDKNGNSALIVADSGQLSRNKNEEIFINLDRGSIYKETDANNSLQISAFRNLRRLVDIAKSQNTQSSDVLALKSSATLWDMGTVPAHVELWWRFHLVLALPMLAIAAFVSIGSGRMRRNWRAIGVLYIVFVYWAYMSALLFVRDWSLAHSAELSAMGTMALFVAVQLISLAILYTAWNYQNRL